MGSTNVRRSTAADAPAIAAVHVRSWQVAYRGIVPDEILDGLSPAQRESAWRTRLERGDEQGFALVAERGQIAGFCWVIPSPDDDTGTGTCEVAAVYVDPDHWRAGIGSALLRAALQEVADAGFDDVTLWAFAANHAALAFYRRFAFAADGAEAVDELSGHKEIRLRAKIRSSANA